VPGQARWGRQQRENNSGPGVSAIKIIAHCWSCHVSIPPDHVDKASVQSPPNKNESLPAAPNKFDGPLPALPKQKTSPKDATANLVCRRAPIKKSIKARPKPCDASRGSRGVQPATASPIRPKEESWSTSIPSLLSRCDHVGPQATDAGRSQGDDAAAV